MQHRSCGNVQNLVAGQIEGETIISPRPSENHLAPVGTPARMEGSQDGGAVVAMLCGLRRRYCLGVCFRDCAEVFHKTLLPGWAANSDRVRHRQSQPRHHWTVGFAVDAIERRQQPPRRGRRRGGGGVITFVVIQRPK